MSPLTVAVLEPSAFDVMRDEWNDLVRHSAANGPFLTWEWLHAWSAHLRGRRTLSLIAVRDGHDLIAIAPLAISRLAPGWFSRGELMGAGNAGSDYLDLIVRNGRERDSLRAIAGVLEAQRRTLRLRNLRPGSCAAQLQTMLSPRHWSTIEAPSGQCPVIPLSGHSFESYLATLGSAHRANYRRRSRALHQAFDVRFDRVTEDADRDACLRALFAFHDTRWQARGGSSAFATPELRAFHQDATRRALECGWLGLYALRLNGALAACMYGFSYDRRFYFYQHGFDDRYRQHSVGLVLMGLTIQAAIEGGAHEFDLLWGTESYKWLWAREARELTALDLFPRHLGGSVHRHAAQARRGARRLVHFLSLGEARAA